MTRSTTRGRPLAPLVILAMALFAGPAWAASHAHVWAASAKTMTGKHDVEARITELHKELKIRPDQESAFKDVAQVMRDNAARMKDLHTDREKSAQSMTAVDTMNSYASVIDAHADGVHKLVPAFETLYNSMSDEQKKVADQVFREKASRAIRKGRS